MATKGRPPSAKTLVDRQLGRNTKHPVLPAGGGFIIPNHSGDHSEGRVDSAPVNDLDIPNKKYVDDLTTNHPHQDVNTTASPTFDELTLTLGTNINYKFEKGTIHASEISLTNQTDDNVGRFALMTKKNDGGDTNLFRVYGNGTAAVALGYLSSGSYLLSSFGEALIIGGTGITITGQTDFTGGNVDITAGDLLISGDGNNVEVQSGEIFNEKSKMTDIGGYAILITNKTGANSVAGETVMADTVTGYAVAQTGANGTNSIGVFLDTGISDGSEAWVVVSGIALVRMDAGGAALGDRIITSATAGRGLVSNAPAVAVHFQEIGHCIQTTAANATGRCVLHFL